MHTFPLVRTLPPLLPVLFPVLSLFVSLGSFHANISLPVLPNQKIKLPGRVRYVPD